MRDIVSVIDEMMVVFPEEGFKRELERIKEDAFYKAPELMYTLWNELHDELNELVEVPLEDEDVVELISIFSGKPIDQVRKDFC